eukprot:jgi/Phyca11/21386/fgenesh1_pg.PHYCAscaffold_93_\
MKLLSTALAVFALLAATTDGSPMLRQTAEGKKGKTPKPEVAPEEQQQQQQDPVQQQQQSPTTSGKGCNLTGTYKKGTDISTCSSITVNSLTVPAGVTLDLSKAKKGAIIEFLGTTTFVFFRLQNVLSSTVSGFTIKNMPFRTFSIVTSKDTTLSGLTIDSRAGNGLAKNTDGFGLTKNDHITITGNKIYNQDDCLAMQSSTNTVFSNNYCCGSHGISVGSLGGNSVDQSTTVQGLIVEGNTIVDSDNGLRIKTIIGLKGLVSDVKYVDNELSNVKNAIVIRSDYSKAKGGYTGAATSQVQITGVKVSGLTGSAKNLYDIKTNPKVVSDWTFSGIDVSASVKGTLTGMPNSLAV